MTYSNGYVRPDAMANLPDWALREFLYRHSGPALEAAKDEAAHRGWNQCAAHPGVTAQAYGRCAHPDHNHNH
jgi:hypothetical protein